MPAVEYRSHVSCRVYVDEKLMTVDIPSDTADDLVEWLTEDALSLMLLTPFCLTFFGILHVFQLCWYVHVCLCHISIPTSNCRHSESHR